MDLHGISPEEVTEFLKSIGLASPTGALYKERERKERQLYDYLTVLRAAVKKLPRKRTVTLLDCACGRSYVSFYANRVLHEEGYRNLHFVCIDHNATLIRQCCDTAKELALQNMEFHTGSIADFVPQSSVDVVMSLHACDGASDETIEAGIRLGARFVLSVSCCQHGVQQKMKPGALRDVTRHKPYKERLADMLADSLRALSLEAQGYQVTVFEFTPASSTPKNILLRAERINMSETKKTEAAVALDALARRFHL